MRFLVDNAISPFVSKGLIKLGHDSIHVRDFNLQAANDLIILRKAAEESRIIISADTDFSFLLSKYSSHKQSVILFRKGAERNPAKQIDLLVANLAGEVIHNLEQGCIVIIEEKRIRIRMLPIIKKGA